MLKNLPYNQKIDFINIDGGGLKICILGWNNFETFRQKFLFLDYFTFQEKNSWMYNLRPKLLIYFEKGYVYKQILIAF